MNRSHAAALKRAKNGAPELENCLKALREGDTLVVWALDRLGGSLSQVITLLDDLKKRGITFNSHQRQNRY
ncbi:DNA invertase [Escherichia coli]|nr:DNA invertase [Escherichia coli]